MRISEQHEACYSKEKSYSFCTCQTGRGHFSPVMFSREKCIFGVNIRNIRRQKEKGTAEDEMLGWLHRLSGRGLQQTPGDGRTGAPATLQSMGLQTVRHDLVTQQQQQIRNLICSCLIITWLRRKPVSALSSISYSAILQKFFHLSISISSSVKWRQNTPVQ